jgi:uncharacterized protein (AIM24 family)
MPGEQWFMAIGGHQVGPVAEEEILQNIRNGSVDANTLVFTAGMSGWTALKDVPKFAAHLKGGPGAGMLPPPPVVPGRRAHDIDFEIHGTEMQFVEVQLDPGESAVAEAGTMMYMANGIQMETVFGDGSQETGQKRGLMDVLVGAGKRLLTGESLFMTLFTNAGSGVTRVAFAAPYAGKIMPLDLKSLGGEIICQKDSFLCAARGVSIGIAFQKRIGVGLFGGEGFIMQRLQGDGLVFVHAGGSIHTVDLKPGETLRVDTGCLVALQPTVKYDIQFVGNVKTALPLSRLADRIYKAIPGLGRGGKEQGSVLDNALGGFGSLIQGE